MLPATEVDSAFHPFEVDKPSSKLYSDVCFLARAAPSGECFRGEGLVWLIGAVVCVVAAALRSLPLALANQLPLPAIVQRGWSRRRRVSSAIEESDLY